MIWAFFTYGTMWFWILSGIWIILLMIFVDREEIWYSFWSVIGYLGLITLFGDVDVFSWLKDHPTDTFRIVILYMIIGVIWGVMKFYFYNSKFQRRIESLKKDFIAQYSPANVERDDAALPSEDMKREWDKYRNNYLTYTERDQLILGKQASKVIFWISYWPVSSFWTILNDPLRRFGELMFNLLFIKIFKWIHKKTIGKAMEL